MKLQAGWPVAKHLETAIKERKFGEDFYYRLSVDTIHLPPLGERAEDMPALVMFFIRRDAREVGVEPPSVQPDAVALLQSQSWPGNVRKMENIVRQSLLLARPFAISLEHVQQVLAKSRKPAAIPSQTHTAYVAGLLSRVQRGE